MKHTPHTVTRTLASLWLPAVLVWTAGCSLLAPADDAPPPVFMTAQYTATPIRVDGKLDEPAWAAAEVYSLSVSRDRQADGQELTEPGEARVAWDDEYIYVAATFTDSDVAAEGDEDGLRHYRFGDLLEVFLKPENNEDQTWYWELYATPAGKRSSFFFPGRGRGGLPSTRAYTCGLRVAAQVDGTVNNFDDKDRRWTAELAMPIKDLTAHGEAFGPTAAWRLFVGRYNYGRTFDRPEMSMTPQLSRTSYHLYEEYAHLLLVK